MTAKIGIYIAEQAKLSNSYLKLYLNPEDLKAVIEEEKGVLH